jgi:prevent-host-death family protein
MIGAYEAKTHLPRMLDEVAAGETITITKRGIPVAKLVPPDAAKPDVEEVINAIHRFRATVQSLGEVTIREMIDEGRRF